jgi:hypothetical protein
MLFYILKSLIIKFMLFSLNLSNFKLFIRNTFSFETIKKMTVLQKSFIALSLVCALLVLGMLPILRQNGDGFSKLLIDPAYAQDNFEVQATLSDSIGVESGTEFLVKSKDLLDAGALKNNISLFPKTEFDFEKLDERTFKVIPKTALQGRQVYNLLIASAFIKEDGSKQERDYSWAFQVKDVFKVMQTLPRNQSTNVPIDTGIEITFSQDNYVDFEGMVSIQPEVKGRFEKHSRTLVFVPEGLSAGTLYTVTVSKELKLDGSDNRLADDYSFQFETDDSGAVRGGDDVLEFEKDFSEFSTTREPVFGIYQYGLGFGQAEVSVYSFNGVDQFIEALKSRSKIPYWATYSRDTYAQDASGLNKVAGYNLPITSYSTPAYHQNFITLPEVVPQGYYLVEMKVDNMVRQAYFQVSDLSIYTSVTDSDTLVWVHDLKTKNPIANASVESWEGGEKISTNENGVATFSTDSFFSLKSDEYLSTYLKVNDGKFTGIVPLDIYSNNNYYGGDANDYWHYFYTDRSLYKPDDTINFWGFVKSRSGADLDKKMKVRLYQGGGYYNYYYEPIVVSEIEVERNGSSISGQLKLDKVSPGYYYLELMSQDKVVSTHYIDVQTYTKPAYDITATAEKYAIFAGEEIVVKVQSSFFEGTPVADLSLTYESDNGSGGIKTDSTGKAEIRIPTKYEDCSKGYDCYYPDYNSVRIHPTSSEEGDINSEAQVRVFGPSIGVESSFVSRDGKNAKIITKVNQIDINKVNSGQEDYYGDYKGDLATGIRLRAEITEISYNKIDEGDYYDFINKIVRKRYSYKSVEKPLGSYEGVTDGKGEHSYDFSIDADKSYRVKIFAYDSAGRVASITDYLSNYNREGYYNYDYYHLVFKDSNIDEDTAEFSVGDKVNLEFWNGQQILPNIPKSDFLYFRMQSGILSYDLSSKSTYSFTFDEKYIPNIYLKGVWFDGNNYHITRTSSWWNGGGALASFKSADHKLNISIDSNKDKYEPGDEVILRAKVTNNDGNPVKTNLNLNLVDEAFYELSQESVDTLNGLYGQRIGSGEMASYASHELPEGYSGAEGGGCFTAGTKIKMADGSYRNIEDVRKGDEILTFENEFAEKTVKTKVAETFRHRVGSYLIINGSLEVTPEHRIFINNGWQMIGEAKVGDVMIDEKGNQVTIVSIEKVRKIVDVYNLRIEKYSTYIADGIYVHNDKNGGREDFVDNALFSSLMTDENGEAEVKFTLPDNLTSWRVTAQGISEDLYAGSGASKVLVSLPAFATMTLSDEYLVSDEPIIKVNSFGAALQSGDEVKFRLDADTLGLSGFNIAGKAFEAQYVNLPKLSEGTHKISASLEAGTNKDKLIRSVDVSSSHLKSGKQKFYELQEGLQIEGSSDGRTDIVFSDKGRGQFYSRLSELSWTYGDRVDQKLSRVLSAQMKKDYFGDDKSAETFDGKIYQLDNGGVALLPYSDSDLELSAKLAVLIPEYFDQNSLASYFYEVYTNQNSTQEEFGLAMLGLAGLGEPILIPVQHFATLSDLSPRSKLYVALAAYELGDRELSRKIYLDFMNQYGENFQYYVRLKVSEDSNENLAFTALSAVLAGGLNDQYREGLWNYVTDHSSKEVLTNLEELLYIKKTLSVLVVDEVSFTFEIGDRREQVKLNQGKSYRLSLSVDELKQLTFSDIIGPVGVTSFYENPSTVEDMSVVSPLVSIGRQYLVNGVANNTFKENSLVEVRLNLNIAQDAPGDSYQVTDLLPSGLKIVTNPYMRGRDYSICSCYPYEIDGQKNKFYFNKSWMDSICGGNYKYYARVISPGTYTAESATIESMYASGVRNYSVQSKVNIERQ